MTSRIRTALCALVGCALAGALAAHAEPVKPPSAFKKGPLITKPTIPVAPKPSAKPAGVAQEAPAPKPSPAGNEKITSSVEKKLSDTNTGVIGKF